MTTLTERLAKLELEHEYGDHDEMAGAFNESFKVARDLHTLAVEMRDALKRHAMVTGYRHVGDDEYVENSHSCFNCSTEWDHGEAGNHKPGCVIAKANTLLGEVK